MIYKRRGPPLVKHEKLCDCSWPTDLRSKGFSYHFLSYLVVIYRVLINILLIPLIFSITYVLLTSLLLRCECVCSNDGFSSYPIKWYQSRRSPDMATPSTRSAAEAERKLMDVVDRRVSEVVSVVDRLVERQDKLDGQFAEMMQALAAINGQLRRQPLKAEEGEVFVGMGGENADPPEDWGRSTRYEFPKFDGDGFEGWLMRAEFFFEVAKVPERGRVRVAAIHMEGKALQWHRGFMNLQGEAGYANWDCYVSALGARFGAQAYEDPLADLRNLRQSGSLQEYMEAFDELYPRTGIREDQALSFFLSGLVDELQMPVRMFKPKRLAEAFSFAKLQELTVRALGGKPKSSSGGGQSGIAAYSGTKSLAVTATTSKPGGFSGTSAPREQGRGGNMRPRLTPKEMDEKRAKGLCYWCPEKFTANHVCSRRRAFVMHMAGEGESEEEDEPVTEETEEPLNLEEIQIMRIRGDKGATKASCGGQRRHKSCVFEERVMANP